jgi:hypothetical protein
LTLSSFPGLPRHLFERDTQLLAGPGNVIPARKNLLYNTGRGIHNEGVLPDAGNLVTADFGGVRQGGYGQEKQNRDRESEQKRFFVHGNSLKEILENGAEYLMRIGLDMKTSYQNKCINVRPATNVIPA